MSKIGERLRQAREEQGLSLAQAATETRIRQQSLQALETGAYEMLPNDVVTKGFLRNYAQYLGLSADEVIDFYRLERGQTKPIRVVPVVSSPPSTRSYILPDFVGVFLVTFFLVALAYAAFSVTGHIGSVQIAALEASATPAVATPTALSTTPPSSTQTATPEAAPAEAAGGVASAPASPTATLEPTEFPVLIPTERAASVLTPTPAQPTPTLAAPIVIEVRIPEGNNEGSWLRVQADGAIVYEQIMLPGTQQIFLAQRQVDIRAGNPPLVQVGVNGLPPEPLGQVPGEPVDWTWPPR